MTLAELDAVMVDDFLELGAKLETWDGLWTRIPWDASFQPGRMCTAHLGLTSNIEASGALTWARNAIGWRDADGFIPDLPVHAESYEELTE